MELDPEQIGPVRCRHLPRGSHTTDNKNCHPSIQLRPYKYSPQKVQVIRNEVAKMLEARVIRENSLSYCSLIVIVEKKYGFCVDYRKLNKATVADN